MSTKYFLENSENFLKKSDTKREKSSKKVVMHHEMCTKSEDSNLISPTT